MSQDGNPTFISSLQNPRIKDAVKLNKRSERDHHRTTLVEGRREVDLALRAGVVPKQAFLCAELLAQDFTSLHRQLVATGMDRQAIFATTPAVYAKLAYRGESGGVVLTVPYFTRSLASLPIDLAPLLLVIEGVEKPGNLGAILRTADAVGVHAVIITDGATDVHNPNTVRAALGATFTVPVAQATQREAADFLLLHQVRLVATTPAADTLYWDADLQGPIAILLGSEADGLSDFWLAAANEQVQLPMAGVVDSLNLSTATAVILYEALRQRTASTLSSIHHG